MTVHATILNDRNLSVDGGPNIAEIVCFRRGFLSVGFSLFAVFRPRRGEVK